MAVAQTRVEHDSKLSLQLLQQQSEQLVKISRCTSATFRAVKTSVEGGAELPSLVTIKRKTTPEWDGPWYENVGKNLGKKLQNAVGAKSYFQLHFLCEKTLMPVEGQEGYELEMPTKELAKFLKAAGPWIGATCAVLKFVTSVARPVAKVAGIDLPRAIISLTIDSSTVMPRSLNEPVWELPQSLIHSSSSPSCWP